MNFTLLQVDNPNKLKALSKTKINFFKKEEDIQMFHFNKIDDVLFHAVFNVSDEYLVSTKKLGNQHNFVYSSLVNFFFISNCHYALLEYINNEYQNEVLEEINKRVRTSVNLEVLNNDKIMKIYKDLAGSIKKLEYSNDDEELFETSYVKEQDLNVIAKENSIDRITVLVENQYISVSKEGKISVDNSDEDFLINFTKRILHAIS